MLGLYAGGLAATLGGTAYAAADVTRRVRTYRREVNAEEIDWQQLPERNPMREAFERRHAFYVAHRLERERDERQEAVDRLAALAGAAEEPRNLLISAVVVVVGITASGAADILATLRAR